MGRLSLLHSLGVLPGRQWLVARSQDLRPQVPGLPDGQWHMLDQQFALAGLEQWFLRILLGRLRFMRGLWMRLRFVP